MKPLSQPILNRIKPMNWHPNEGRAPLWHGDPDQCPPDKVQAGTGARVFVRFMNGIEAKESWPVEPRNPQNWKLSRHAFAIQAWRAA